MSEGRYELKYVVRDEDTPQLLRAVEGHVVPDAHADPLPSGGYGYVVSSVYLDTDDFYGYSERLRGERIRNRVRLRTYGRAGEKRPLFLECKRKLDELVIKHRTRMGDVDTYQTLPERHWESIDDRATQRFSSAVAGMTAKCIVRYEREVFVAGTSRLTIDRFLRGGPVTDCRQLYAPAPIALIPDEWTVVELKFNGQMPVWMRKAAALLKLYSEPVSKFALGMVKSHRNDRPLELRQVIPSTVLVAVA